MALRAQWVGYGRPAAETLRSLIATAKAGDPLAPVTVVVSSNHVGVAARRRLAAGEEGAVDPSRPGLVAVDFLTPFRLAERYGAAVLAAEGRLPVSNPVVTTAVREVLSADAGVFSSVAEHPATEEALVGAYRELRDVPPQGLEALSAAGSKAADVVRICATANRRLAAGWYDEQDLAAAAAETVRTIPAEQLGLVVVYLPQRLSSSMAGLICAVADRHDVVVVAGTVGDVAADREVVVSVGRLGLGGPEREDPEREGPERGDPEPEGRDAVYRPGVTEIVTASDADEEVRQAVRRAVQSIRDGARADRIAILYPSAEPYARLVHEHLRAACLPANGAAVIPLKERVAPRALLALTDLRDGDYSRIDVMAWLAATPLGLGGSPVPVSAWERLARRAGVVHGRGQWDLRLAAMEGQDRPGGADEGTAGAIGPGPEGNPEEGRSASPGGLAARLRSFVVDLIDAVSAAGETSATWSERSRWAAGLLEGWFGPAEERMPDWPDDEARAYLRLIRALHRLAALDGISGPVDLGVFMRTLELELDDDLGRTGRLGQGILVGPIGLGVGLDLDLMVVLGMAEGSYPTAVRDDSLLADFERARVGDGHLALRRDMVGRQHRLLLASAASARRQVLCLPRGDLRATTQRSPSRWLLDAAARIGVLAPGRSSLGPAGGGLTEVASFLAGLVAAHFASNEQERRLQEILIGAHGLSDGVYRTGRQMVMARRSRAFTRFDGNLAGVAIPSPVEQTLSATRLESWVDCPHAYFMHYVLGVRDLDEPSEENRITPLDRGSLIHEALERFVKEAGADRRPWDRSDRERMARIADEVCDAYESRGVTGTPLYWSSDRRRIHADLDRFITEDVLSGAGAGTWPVAAEHRFESAVLDLPDGRSIRLQGMIDRIDSDPSGAVTVIDYKTGRADPYRHIDTSDPGGSGAHLQLVIYALAAADHLGSGDVSAYYWMVSDQGGWGRYGYRVDDEVVSKVAATVHRIVTGIEQGVFPAHPTRSSTSPWPNCDYCDLDGMGETDLRRAWERKREDPAMAAYRDLVEPADG